MPESTAVPASIDFSSMGSILSLQASQRVQSSLAVATSVNSLEIAQLKKRCRHNFEILNDRIVSFCCLYKHHPLLLTYDKRRKLSAPNTAVPRSITAKK